ncbi:cell division protein [compost metagenome]
MKSLCLQGVRGGVGNSALLAAIGHALHCLGQRVLLVDMCPENLLGMHFNLPVAERGGWARAMLDGQGWHSQAWGLLPGLCVLPYGRLQRPEQEQIEQRLCNEPQLWARRERSLAEHFDWVLFDLPQRLQIQVLEADAACHALLQQQDVKRYLLVNRFDPASQLQNDLLLVWRNRYGARLLPVTVHDDEAMREALACKAPVGRYAESSLVAQDVMSLATWCLAHSRGEL